MRPPPWGAYQVKDRHLAAKLLRGDPHQRVILPRAVDPAGPVGLRQVEDPGRGVGLHRAVDKETLVDKGTATGTGTAAAKETPVAMRAPEESETAAVAAVAVAPNPTMATTTVGDTSVESIRGNNGSLQ
jgi:hypothetical protein